MKIIFMSLIILVLAHGAYAEGSRIEEVVDVVTLKLTNGETVRFILSIDNYQTKGKLFKIA
jgi:hypothetical protein